LVRSLSFTVTELPLLPVWGNFSDFPSKEDQNRSISVLVHSLSFTVIEMRLLPVLDNFPIVQQKDEKFVHFNFGVLGELLVFTLFC
jgi:hypothetical protein